MEEIVIKTHDFEEAKAAIKAFSEQELPEVNIREVNAKKSIREWFLGGGFSRKHNVTGEEFNERIGKISTQFVNINETQIKLIKEFESVYLALEALDKDYIQAILLSIKATEATSEQIALTQEHLKKTVEDQRKTLEVLKEAYNETRRNSDQIEDFKKHKQILESLVEKNEKTNAKMQQLGKKIKYAYWIAGGSLALALVELVVLMIG